MLQSKHCHLCKHENRSLKNGLTCGLTKKKPDFKTTCDKFSFSVLEKDKYIQTKKVLEHVKSTRNALFFKFYILLIISLGVVFVGKLWVDDTGGYGLYALKVAYFFYGFGALFFVTAFTILSKYKKRFIA